MKNVLPKKLLKEAVRKAREMENTVYEKRIMKNKKHIFSDKYRRKIEKIKKNRIKLSHFCHLRAYNKERITE